MGVFYTIVWICIIGLVLFWLYLDIQQKIYSKKRNHKIADDFKSVPFQLDKSFKYFNSIKEFTNDQLFGINKKQKKIVFYNYFNKPKFKVCDFSSIISVKKIVDDETVSTSSAGGTIGRALVGGVLAGGVGAVVGGITGKKTGKQAIKKLELEIILNDIEHPSYVVPFFISPKAKEVKFDETLEKADKEINEWLNIFKVILYQNEHPSSNKDVMK